MFCRHCGNQLPDGAKFCNRCGNAVMDADPSTPQEEATPIVPPDYPQSSVDTTTQQSPFQDAPPPQTEPPEYTTGSRATASIRSKPTARNIVISLLVGVAIVVVAGVFGVRAVNETTMKQAIPSMIYEASEGDVIEYYDQVMPYPYSHDLGYTYGGDFTTFELTKGDDSNTFHVTGELFVTDISREDRPDYTIYIDGTVTTNFFRSDYSAEWTYRVENPPVVQPEPESEQNQWEPDWTSGDLKDVYSWVEGEYHQAHYYPMVMYLTISEEESSEPLVLYFLFNNDGEIWGDGYVSYVGGDDLPRFEGVLNSSWEPISIEYDGYNFIVDCPALELEEMSFFMD